MVIPGLVLTKPLTNILRSLFKYECLMTPLILIFKLLFRRLNNPTWRMIVQFILGHIVNTDACYARFQNLSEFAGFLTGQKILLQIDHTNLFSKTFLELCSTLPYVSRFYSIGPSFMIINLLGSNPGAFSFLFISPHTSTEPRQHQVPYFIEYNAHLNFTMIFGKIIIFIFQE
jgi:hypothetical protein